MTHYAKTLILTFGLFALSWKAPLMAAAADPEALTSNSEAQEDSSGFDSAYTAGDNTTPPQDDGDPPQDGDDPVQDGGDPPQDSGDPPQDSGDPPQDNGDPPQNGDDPPQDGGDPPQDGGDPPQNGDDPPQDSGDPPQDGDDPVQDGDDPPQDSGDPPQDSGDPPQDDGDPPQDSGNPMPDGDEGAAALTFTETLQNCRIESGETLSFTTISSSFAGTQIPGYYPGELTVSIEGDIIIEAGGTLAIGTLSIGGSEASPVVTGSGSIIVEPDGELRLIQAVLQAEGGLKIVQQPGGSVYLQVTDPPDGMITWSAPLVQNQYDNPDDLWLEQGTPLTADMLPSSLHTTVQFQGSETDAALALVWDLSAYDGRTEGEKVTLSGRFLDENGQTLLSAVPLTLTVHWYAPEILIVTDAVWKGETVPTVQLTVQNLPDPDDFWGEIWGEVSTDGGQT